MSEENICKCVIHQAAPFSPTVVEYCLFPDNSTGQYANSTAPGTGQFAENLVGHLTTSKLGMFGSESYATYGQQYGTAGYTAPQYTQWPDSQAGGWELDRVRGGRAYSYLGNVQGNEDARPSHGNGAIMGYTGPSWASVASQPVKPQPAPAKAKKLRVLAPPTIIRSSEPPVMMTFKCFITKKLNKRTFQLFVSIPKSKVCSDQNYAHLSSLDNVIEFLR